MRFSLVSADGRSWALRSLREDDADRVLAWRNDPRIRAAMTTAEPIAPAEHHAWLARVMAAESAVVTLFELDGEPVGFMQLSQLDRRNANARWGFYLRPQGAPPGSGSRMGYLMLRHAFEELGLHRVYADVIADNPASLALHRKLGFVEEGRWREQLRRAASWQDVVLFGLQESEFAVLRDPLERNLFR